MQLDLEYILILRYSVFLGTINLLRAIDARLQTAVSFLSEYSTISVQRLEDLITPRFC